MKTLRAEVQFLQYLLNTKELSMEGIVMFLRHSGYRVKHIPPPAPEVTIDLSDLSNDDGTTGAES